MLKENLVSALAETQWHVFTTENGPETVAFYADGTALISFPDGNVANARWEEDPDGHFMFRLHFSLSNPKINQVYFGTLREGEARGYWGDAKSKLNDFTMIHES